MEGVERVWHRRLRWRLRGAWLRPAFLTLTVVNGILLVTLPPYEGGPDHYLPGALLAGVVNLLAVVLLAPAFGRLLRRRRPDLPRLVASDYAGAGLLVAITALLVATGLAHRSAVSAELEREQTVAAAMLQYVIEQEPAYADSLAAVDTIRIEQDYYRACIPRDQPDRWLCLFVTTDQHPPGITRDTDETSNTEGYRPYGGFEN
jgi:4-amino-4-deoxy-L-arabinose transferase-like glycosyltransferase